MLRLNIPREPRWIALPHGVRLLLRPATAALVTTARLRAGRELQEMRAAVQTAKDSGMPLGDLPDVTEQARAEGYAFALTVLHLGRELVTDWDGVADADGAPLDFDVQQLPQVLSHPDIAEGFYRAVNDAQDEIVAEGNA